VVPPLSLRAPFVQLTGVVIGATEERETGILLMLSFSTNHRTHYDKEGRSAAV